MKAIQGTFGFEVEADGNKDLNAAHDRVETYGFDAVTNKDLLAVVLKSEEVAEAVLKVGDLRELEKVSDAELGKVKGMTRVRVNTLRAVLKIGRRLQTIPLKGNKFTCSRQVWEAYGQTYGADVQENFLVVLLDARNRVIREERVSRGTMVNCPVCPADVFRPVIRDGASAIILVHNHPSMDTDPSTEDKEITRRIKQSGEMLGIRVLDHIVISESSYFSFADQGLL